MERNQALSKGQMEVGNLLREAGSMVWLTVRNAAGLYELGNLIYTVVVTQWARCRVAIRPLRAPPQSANAIFTGISSRSLAIPRKPSPSRPNSPQYS